MTRINFCLNDDPAPVFLYTRGKISLGVLAKWHSICKLYN